jgi:D-3-phosphoglycerate dehydrogenase
MSKFKVVVTDFEYTTFAPEKSVLDKLGIELTLEQCKTEDEVIAACKDADGLISQYAPISQKVIEKLENCKVISRYGVGYNTVDVDAATEKGIIVGNVPDYCLDEVSDHAMALLLSSVRKITKLNNAVKSGNWDFKVAVPVYRLRGRTLGLVGFGNIPQMVAKKAQAFGLNIIAYDPFVSVDVAKKHNVELVSLDELCEKSDYISVHVPLNQYTQGMISDDQFNRMKKEAFIINTARGPIIDEKALITALQTEKIAGAGLDVLEVEPIDANNPLLKMDNVLLNPHSAFYSIQSEEELKRKAAQNVADVLSGYYPPYVVNKDVKGKLNLKEKVYEEVH